MKKNRVRAAASVTLALGFLAYVVFLMSGESLTCYATVTSPALNPKGLSTTLARVPQIGTPLSLTVTTEGTAPAYYRFFVGEDYGASWNEIQGWSTDSSCTYTPTREGNYVVVAHVTDSAQGENYGQAGFSFATAGHGEAGVVVTGITSDLTYPQIKGSPITLTAQAVGGGTIYYKFWHSEGTSWKVIHNWATSNTTTWTPDNAGDYTVVVWASQTPDDTIPHPPIAGFTCSIGEEVASRTIGKAGGTLTAYNTRGDRVSLEIPSKALAGDTAITLRTVGTPLSNPIAENIFPGVKIEPQGLMLREPAKLKVTFATSLADPNHSALFYLKRSDFALPIGNQTPNRREIQGEIYHFSDYCGGQPSSAEALGQADKANSLPSADPFNWQATYDVLSALLEWEDLFESMGMEEEAQTQKDRAKELLEQAISNFLNQPIPSDPCKDYLQALLKYHEKAILFGLEEQKVQLLEARLTDALNQCSYRFELEYNHKVIHELSGSWYDQWIYSGRVPFYIPLYGSDDFGKLEGTGTIQITGSGTMGDCQETVSGAVEVSVGGDMVLTDAHELELNLILDEIQSIAFEWCCPNNPCATTPSMSHSQVNKTLPVREGSKIELATFNGSIYSWTLHIVHVR